MLHFKVIYSSIKNFSLLCFVWCSSLSGLTQHAFCGLTDICLHLGYGDGDVWEHTFAW